ncbi:MAG: hypothetical protein IPJ33_14400 [Gammaproteobacteria bacterium]|jgi:hypothetical protein|nr:hypothetical protein [Gammaproteobacteria bacterium]MBK6585145.1 hypothetical protein [Gammaproteobacteria bacterium]MBK7168791.1 hypothetical protein [Gammaproteobacteria bacterium]MBK7520141.1 hypothetical protein [Gammaproteobacteria bacterium]MBK7729639.1 hypothetical protein [Gammaproteobacteria bacterium]
MIMSANNEVGRERMRLNFGNAVRMKFSRLINLGFIEVESLPTIVRYQKDDLEIRIYHGRKSFEIGFEICHQGSCYSISELIRAIDSEAADRYRNYTATTSEAIGKGLTQLEQLVLRYAERALQSDPVFFEELEADRRAWAEGYSLDVLAELLRPKADAAFRSGNYLKAAELYERICPRLSAAELKKLAIAKERAAS